MTETIKCLVWDLDQTLWRGVLLEDGEVTLADEVRGLVAELDARGILQSIASRNDHDHAWERLEKLGIAEYFVLPQIGWGRKSDSVRAIADTLGFAHRTIAFVDDQPTECAEVAYHLPDVRCYPASAVPSLLGLPEFSPAVTVDARRRREMYQAGFRREAERAGFDGPDEDFLRSLSLRLRIFRAGEEELTRVEELTLRTSQMNATGVHYSDSDLRSLLDDPRHEVLVTTLTDRFGPHGAVGVVLVERHASVWHLKLLATSCRVVSFGAGAVILRWLADQAARAGAHLVADFRRTDRNRMMEIAYRFAGFDDAACTCRLALGEAADGIQRLHLTPSRQEPSNTMRVIAPDLADKTLWEWFADSAARFPSEPALEVRDHTLSYVDLHDRAERIATALVAAHRAVPKRIALLASRSVTAYAGYLAAQRLGATVVPINPGYPAERNGLVCRLTGVDVLLADDTGATQLPKLPPDAAATIVQLSDVDLLPDADLPPYQGDPDALAYVLFTSGSTGVPKGVPIRHRQVSPYLARQVERYKMEPGCRTSHTFDLTFDPSIFDLFVTWGGGATLVVPQRSELLTPVDYIVDRRLTHWYSVPSVLSISATLGNLPAGLVESLRYSIFVGEPLTRRQCLAWRAVAPSTIIENVYGPTEFSVTCTAYALPADPADWPSTSNDTVPIGAVHPSQEYLFLPDGDDARPSAGGELCLRGPQRFDGYLDPAENTDRFVDADGSVHNGPLTDEHYYRTGDIVRIEDGHWVHHGRRDNQFKVRGYRVELGEVEAAMLRHPDVNEAIVVATRRLDEIELVGVHTGAPIDATEFMRWLRRRIPVHMVPRRFRHLDALPLNPNGKADRRLLTEQAQREVDE